MEGEERLAAAGEGEAAVAGRRRPEEEEVKKLNPVQMEKQEYSEKRKGKDRKSIHRIQHLRDELEEGHREDILERKETYLKAVKTKYKNDPELIKTDITAANSEIPHNLKLETLRQSADYIHTSQLELMQSNLRKEKETALIELREMLKDRHAQELAVLQGQHHLELERIKKQNDKEKEEMALKHKHDMDKEKREIALNMEEKYVKMLENCKKEWELNRDVALKNLSDELLAKRWIELNEVKKMMEMEVEGLRGELVRLSREKEQGEMEHKKMESQYHLAMKKLQTEHEQQLKEVTEQSKTKEGELQQEIQKLKAESEEEIKQLRSQLDSARASRQELSELKEQLLARTSQMEEIEVLKRDFQLKWNKKRSEHENELEQLRVYFEQKLKSAEENYREELTMLHQRMEEVKDCSLVEIENGQEQHVEDGPSTTLLKETTEKERQDLLDQQIQQPAHQKEELCCLDEKHRKDVELLRSSLTVEYQESLRKMKMDLSEKYASSIECLKRKHCLELEQLRAKISEEHLREIAKLHLQSAQGAAHQVEAEVAKCLLDLENEYKAKFSDLQTKMLSISTLQEEIERLSKENAELKGMNVLQAMHLKEFEQKNLTIALEKQRESLEDEYYKALEILQKEILSMKEQHRHSIEELDSLHTLELKKEKEKWQQLQKDREQLISDKQQLEKENRGLNKEMEDASTEMRNLCQQEDRENQEGTTVTALLKSDIERGQNERKQLQESYQQVLKLLLKMMKASKDAEGLICKKIGLCLDNSFTSVDSGESQNMSGETVLAKKVALTEKWNVKKISRVGQGEVLALTLPEDSFDSLMPDEISELSQHLCESIFENPDLVFEKEEKIHTICHCLHVAVEKLLDQLAKSTKQLEEMHNIRLHMEEEFTRKNVETCQVINEHQELVGCLNEENKVKNQLVLELHKTKGLMEGCLAERHTLQEALKLKEESECRLVLELETLKAESRELKQKLERSVEEQKLLRSQNKALTVNVGEQEVGLIKEIEHLAKAKLEVQCQAEKDCSTLNAQIKILEMELEEQLNKNQKLVMMSSEVTDLREQMQSLERQLKNQRDFMDKQAVERENERDEFQEEIQKLEMQLKLTAKLPASGQLNLEDSLYNEIKGKTEDFNRLLLEKEHIQKGLDVQNEQIKKLETQIRELEQKNKEEDRNANQLKQELQKMKKMEAELKQDKEALQQQNHNNLIQISDLHSKLDEAKHKMLTDGNSDHILNEQLKVQEELISKKREIACLSEQLERYKVDLVNKNEEVLQLSSKLEVERNVTYTQINQLKEENAHLKENIAKGMQSQNPEDNVVLQFLKSLLEEKNQETDHLNEQMMRLQCKIENSKENEILKNQACEIQDLKSIIERLHGDKERLLKDKTEETEQLQRIIQKLQQELALLAPVCQEADNSQNSPNTFAVGEQEDMQNQMRDGSLSHQVNRGEDDNCISLNSNQNQLQDQLATADREALRQSLEEKEAQLKAEIKILEQSLQNIQEPSEQHFTALTALQLQYQELEEEHKLLQVSLTQKTMEMTRAAISIQKLEDKLREKETILLQRELQLQRMSEEKSEQAIEVQQMKGKVEWLENEQHALTQTLCEKEAISQREISELQAALAELKSQVEEKVGELETLRSKRDLFYSQLKSDTKKDQENDEQEINLDKPVPNLGDFVSHKEVGEVGEERGPSNKLSMSPDFSYRDKLEIDIAMSNLNLCNVQDKDLETLLCLEEGKTINDDKEEKDLQPLVQQMCQLSHFSQTAELIEKGTESFQSMVMEETLQDSPEMLRKQNSWEVQPGLPLTPFSDIDSTSISSDGLCSEHSVAQGVAHGLLEWSVPCSNGNEEIGASVFVEGITFPGSTTLVTEYDDVQKDISVSNAEGFTPMPPDLQDDLRMTMSRREDARTEHVSNTCSDLVLQVNQEESKTTVQQDGSVMTSLQCFGKVPDITEPATKAKEMFSKQLKNVLKRVYEESHKILELSEKSQPSYDKEQVPKAPSVEGWQRERLALLDTVQSLKDYLSKVPEKENKENASSFFDWRGELLQAVQRVLEKEWIVFQSYLQSHFHTPGSGDERTLVEKLEHIMEQQEQQQKIVLEHLVSSDRNSLLTEIQGLEAQLRLRHLQSQEKLQQLQEILINTENHGSNQEHQLRRQVELLEYKLQQEKSIVSDLQASLKSEQEKASEMHDLLKQEHTAIFNLKSDLCENKQANERLQKSLQELQKEVVDYSSALESKENAIAAVLQDLQNEKLKRKELQDMLDEQQQQNKLREDEKSKAIEEVQAALELQCIQNNQLCVALEHEQSANSNLRKELQIEHSRCEALLSQDQNKLLELQKTVEVEKNRNLELLSTLNHERLLTKQLSVKINQCGSCKHKGSLQELQAQLYREKSHARELLGIIEKTQQQVLDSKKVMEKKQIYYTEPEKEQDLHISLQVTHELPNKKLDIVHASETQMEKGAEMKRDWEELILDFRSLKIQENKTEQAVRDQSQERQTECDKSKTHIKNTKKAREYQHEFEVQQRENVGRIKELQQMLKDLKKQGQYFNYHKNQHKPASCPLDNNDKADSIMLCVEQQKLENIREQLLCAAAYLSEFLSKTIDKTVNWPASNDEAVAALLHILELKAELLASSKPVVIPTCVTNLVKESERLACEEEKHVLQNGLKATDCEANPPNFAVEAKSTMVFSKLRVQKLYRKYLRAESFRKALVYQKNYLLLLLGGFQECEQATLSLIARMGVYPSLPGLNASGSRSRLFTKFRSAVRVVIAISRLKFLVKKWHKINKKDQPSATILPSTGHKSYPQAGPKTLKLRQPFSGDATEEAACCKKNKLIRRTDSSPKSPHHLDGRLTSYISQASSKDPDTSLTEYIAHLEAVQQKLGSLMLGQSPQKEAL